MEYRVINGVLFRVRVKKGLLVMEELPTEEIKLNKKDFLQYFSSTELLDEVIARSEKKDD